MNDTPDPWAHERDKPEILKACAHCKFCVGYVTLWCVNKEATEKRGTSIPGIIHCPYWEPDKKTIKKFQLKNYFL